MRSNSTIPDNLITSLLDKFVPRFAPGSKVIHAIGSEPAPDKSMLQDFGVVVPPNQKIPDAVLYCPKRNWLLLVETTTGNGLMNENRLKELARLFDQASPDLIYVTTFQSRSNLADHDDLPAWGTHAWFADEPDHIMHFNGSRFLGPYSQ